MISFRSAMDVAAHGTFVGANFAKNLAVGTTPLSLALQSVVVQRNDGPQGSPHNERSQSHHELSQP